MSLHDAPAYLAQRPSRRLGGVAPAHDHHRAWKMLGTTAAHPLTYRIAGRSLMRSESARSSECEVRAGAPGARQRLQTIHVAHVVPVHVQAKSGSQGYRCPHRQTRTNTPSAISAPKCFATRRGTSLRSRSNPSSIFTLRAKSVRFALDTSSFRLSATAHFA